MLPSADSFHHGVSWKAGVEVMEKAQMTVCAAQLPVPGCDYLHGIPLNAWFCTLECGHQGEHFNPSRAWQALPVNPAEFRPTQDQIQSLYVPDE